MTKLLLSGLVLTGLALAQDLPKFDVARPDTPQVLKMRYTGLSRWADEHSQAMNEAEADALAGWYAGIRREANRPLLKDKPALVQAMKDLSAWNSCYYETLYLYKGGGTLYSHAGKRSVASLADVEADAAIAWSQPGGKTPRGRTFAQQHPDWLKVEQDQAELKKAVAREGVAFQKATASLVKLPIGAREVLATYLATTSEGRWGEN
ncbi:MAG: hypothetical protein KF760_16375 [Candidatus Eremiobacteraeota bacterium]|nr:hypothetical protein [Candidatus Eremiobacteraeota bacterium]MCW5870439.1 hypothetical protein [Candidatus Eremiobacteraeota bacterium]